MQALQRHRGTKATKEGNILPCIFSPQFYLLKLHVGNSKAFMVRGLPQNTHSYWRKADIDIDAPGKESAFEGWDITPKTCSGASATKVGKRNRVRGDVIASWVRGMQSIPLLLRAKVATYDEKWKKTNWFDWLDVDFDAKFIASKFKLCWLN